MKKILMAIAITLIFTACNKTPGLIKSDPPKTDVKIEKVTNEISHGLYKVQIDDTTTVLIYRGVESVTMIQLK
jgi:uncharacterized lipoprotein YajG